MPCISNLRQLWQASSLYAVDYDDKLPYAASKFQKDKKYPKVAKAEKIIDDAMLINDALKPYVENNNIWKCPMDVGGGYYLGSSVLPHKYVDSYYHSFGVSYLYDFNIPFSGKSFSSIEIIRDGCPFPKLHSSEIILFSDATGYWHGKILSRNESPLNVINQWRVNAVYMDGHAKSNVDDGVGFTHRSGIFYDGDYEEAFGDKYPPAFCY